MADRKGGALRRVLFSADCKREAAIFRGSSQVKTPGPKSIAKLCLVTYPDHFFLSFTAHIIKNKSPKRAENLHPTLVMVGSELVR